MTALSIVAHSLESDFRQWSKPPSATEDERCGNAESVVRNAIESFQPFTARNIEVFAQGSYRNGTNVRANSDVDICIRCMDICFSDMPDGLTKTAAGLSDSSYTYAQFKNDVEEALKLYLGEKAVSRGDKAFDLHANTYRVDADAVATLEHRRYSFQNGKFDFLSGTELHPDSGGRIINWPHQNFRNGTSKNSSTNGRFKKMVRVLKRLRSEMNDGKIAAAKPIPSFLIECLVWNTPDSAFAHDDYSDNLRAILLHLFSQTETDLPCNGWGEINELKYLFRPSQPWTRSEVNAFIVASWTHANFK